MSVNLETPAAPETQAPTWEKRVELRRLLPYVGVHLACFGAFFTGISWIAVVVCIALYLLRMFAITGFYHRYFSHRTFKTHRWSQFLFAFLGNTSAQNGPLWWAAHHRKHHRHSDEPADMHSPKQHGFLWSHMLWFFAPGARETDVQVVRDLARYPELRFLDRHDTIAPVALGVFTFLLGKGLEIWAPGLGTTGWQMLVWGFFISTVAVYHGTYTINSLAHVIGRRRFETDDTSRNSFLLSLVTLGEGWHNNHHHYQTSVRQGFYWWELDLTYYALKVLSWMGVIWDLRPVPAEVLAEGRRR